MKIIFAVILGIGFLSPAAAELTGRGGLYFGQKSLDRGDWGSLDSQSAWGLDLDVKDTSWPVWATAGYVSSRERDTVITSVTPFATGEIEGKTSEIHLGVKKDFIPYERVRFSVGGGPAWVRASLDSSVAPFSRDSDSSAGYWAGAETFVFLKPLVLGVSYRHSHAKMDLFGRSVNAGGENLAFTVGFGW